MNRIRISKETICDNLSKAVSHFRIFSFALTAAGFSTFGRTGLIFLIVVIALLSAAADLTTSDKSKGINS